MQKSEMRPPRLASWVLAASAVFAAASSTLGEEAPAGGATFAVRKVSTRAVRIECGGQLLTEYWIAGVPRPILYPVIGPHGVAMTRHFPMRTDVPGEPKDHRHHRSVWFAHGAVNGIDFWTEGPGKGVIEHETLLELKGGSTAKIVAADRWLDAGGKVVCRDTQTIAFRASGTARCIDYQVVIHASEGPLTFGDSKEGMMAVRTHPQLQLTPAPLDGVPEVSGRAVNSEGVQGAQLWGRRARWVDYWGAVDGHVVGIAMFDHPANPRHPTWWMARDYGLVAANPFGIHEFEGRPPGTGEMKVAAGDSVTFRYLLVFHEGGAQQAGIDGLYQSWINRE